MAALVVILLTAEVLASGPDISNHLVDVGNKPSASGQRGTSLNVWDLQAFDGKIFIGLGDTARNTGPQPVWAFDHATRQWGDEPEAIIEQEAIELFRVLDGELYIPAADPKGEVGDRSKFYRREADGGWTHFISTSGFNTAHIRDLVVHDGWVIGVGNSRRPPSSIAGP